MEKSRMAALADGIFAVVMTLLVLDLKLPEGVETITDAEVWQQLLELKGHVLIYVLSFIVLGSYWIGHHSLFHFVRRVNWGLLWLNLLFLLFITLVPFSTNLLAGRSHLRIPVVVYGINLLLLSLTFLWHLRYLAQHPELCREGMTPSRIAEVRWRSALAAFTAAASIVIAFYRPALALNAYWLLLALHFLRARTDHYPAADEEGTR